MNGAALGANFCESAGNRLQAVVPTALGLSGPFQSKAAPPHGWTSIPKWVLYQAPKAFGSLDLKKMPPIPVTRFISSPVLKWWPRFSFASPTATRSNLAKAFRTPIGRGTSGRLRRVVNDQNQSATHVGARGRKLHRRPLRHDYGRSSSPADERACRRFETGLAGERVPGFRTGMPV